MSRTYLTAALLAGSLLALPIAANAEEISPDTVWQLQSVAGEPVEAEVTLQIGADGAVSGNASCNQYRGQNTATLPDFALGPVAATQMLCPDMETETAYLAALELITQAEIQDGMLVLSSSDDGAQMVFAPSE
ncbi:MAG: META domain-containing protein [Pseudomonadota bacterium]